MRPAHVKITAALAIVGLVAGSVVLAAGSKPAAVHTANVNKPTPTVAIATPNVNTNAGNVMSASTTPAVNVNSAKYNKPAPYSTLKPQTVITPTPAPATVTMCKPVGGGVEDIEAVSGDLNQWKATGYVDCTGVTGTGYCITTPLGEDCSPSPHPGYPVPFKPANSVCYDKQSLIDDAGGITCWFITTKPNPAGGYDYFCNYNYQDGHVDYDVYRGTLPDTTQGMACKP